VLAVDSARPDLVGERAERRFSALQAFHPAPEVVLGDLPRLANVGDYGDRLVLSSSDSAIRIAMPRSVASVISTAYPLIPLRAMACPGAICTDWKPKPKKFFKPEFGLDLKRTLRAFQPHGIVNPVAAAGEVGVAGRISNHGNGEWHQRKFLISIKSLPSLSNCE